MDWQARCNECGFDFHSIGGVYWDESACWVFSEAEIDVLEAATAEVHAMCLDACDRLIRADRFEEFSISPAFAEHVSASWRAREPSLFGRFDLAWNGEGAPKLLEYNADTPTSLPETSVAQWFWLQDVKARGGAGDPGADADQFNSLHEKLIDRWRVIAKELLPGTLYFACVKDNEEDAGNLRYLRDTAMQAGIPSREIFIEDLGWAGADGVFADLAGMPVERMFKLYPWEWLVREPFGVHLLRRSLKLIEPAWKMLLSNKALLAVLWEMHPGHPNLLPATLDPVTLRGDYVRKPKLSREGANVSLRRAAGAVVSGGTYGGEGFVYQAYAPIARSGDNYAVIGSWIVGNEPAGIGIREDNSPITRNTSRFVPHYFC